MGPRRVFVPLRDGQLRRGQVIGLACHRALALRHAVEHRPQLAEAHAQLRVRAEVRERLAVRREAPRRALRAPSPS